MSKTSCHKLTNQIKEIKSLRDSFADELAGGNFENCLRLKREISHLTEAAVESLWSLDILIKENISKQYEIWNQIYNDLDLPVTLPEKEKVMEFITKDREFLDLMSIKEKQGFTNLIIAPAPGTLLLKDLANIIRNKIKKCGGASLLDIEYTWDSMFESEDDIRYFAKINYSTAPIQMKGGVTASEIQANPDQYSVCDGWMISFATGEQNILNKEEANIDTGNGRLAIKTGLKGEEYFRNYCSKNKYKQYLHEEVMIPQEYFALFAKDLYTKCVLTGDSISKERVKLLDYESGTWFLSTYLPSRVRLPVVRWSKFTNGFSCYGRSLNENSIEKGIRTVVRKKY